MATPDSFWEGMSAAIIGIIFSVVLFFGVGLPAEKLLATFESTDIYDLPEEWASYDNISFWMSLMYIVIIAPAAVGIITMFLSAIKTQRYDVITDSEAEAAPQYISQEEILYQQGRL